MKNLISSNLMDFVSVQKCHNRTTKTALKQKEEEKRNVSRLIMFSQIKEQQRKKSKRN